MGCRRRLGCEGGVGVVGQGGRKVLCRFEKITALEVVTGNVNVGGLSTIIVGQVQRGWVEKFHAPKGANSSA